VAGVVRHVLASGAADVVGLTGSLRGHLARELLQAAGPGNRVVLAVTADENSADLLARDLAFFLGSLSPRPGAAAVRIPADPILPYDDLSPDRALEMERLAGLCQLHLDGGKGVRAAVLSVRALARRTVPRALFDRLADAIGPKVTFAREALAARLVDLGYARVPLVEDMGTFAVRGGIIDLWSPLDAGPVRLEYFGDEIESCRRFDPTTQRSLTGSGAEVDEVILCPAREALFTAEGRAAATAAVREVAEQVDRPTTKVREVLDAIGSATPFFGMEALLPGFHAEGLGSLFDFLPPEPIVYLDDAAELARSLKELWTDLEKEYQTALERGELALPPSAHFLEPAEVMAGLARARGQVRRHDVWMGTDDPIRVTASETHAIRAEIEASHGDGPGGLLAPLLRRLEDWRSRGLASVIACGSHSAADRLRRLLEDRRMAARNHTGPFAGAAPLFDPGIHAHLLPGELSGGFVDGEARLALLTDEEIFGKRVRKKVRATRSENAFTAAFRDLNEGDLVVHVEHGIARYSGLTKMQIRGVEGDFLILQYDGADKLYLPVSKLRQVQKFTGASPDHVRLDRLGGTSFAQRKARVKEQLLKMAAELLDIYAARAAHPGFAFTGPDGTYQEFEAEFPYEETPDQQKAIDDVLSDMGKARPMDRLVCGDVGYGKTEVALRAAMLAILSKKQVAVLVPTTVLAAQHERTFRERFKGYPVRVDSVSRMKRPEQVKRTLAEAAEGKLDVLIGTHRLLASDVNFKDLGLLVVDEEQRFGVTHKERIKKIRKLVDVLTLTATPIPRTLHMSMSGVRDLSIIATPPEDRRSIRTFVLKFDRIAIRDAILQELKRGGQVFFVHNRVRSIAAMEKFLTELVPEARIGIAHGQMAEGKLEQVMGKFVERELDLLLCTTLIESGLDIPSANTIIVNRADHMGLAQLYQIRGRVGRSRERAYAYLMVPARRPVTKEARQRLEVLQRFTELGAGFSIASHDLEIRGAGNILGKDQSGQIEAVGFDLYTQLMEEAVRELRGEAPREEIDPDVQLPIPAFIPEGYMPDVHQRLYFYKRLAQAGNDEELEDIRGEIIDRYGEPPEELDALCQLMEVKVRLRAFRIRGLESGPNRVVLALGREAALDPVKLASRIQASKGALRLTPEMKLVATVAEASASRLELLDGVRKLLAGLAECATP
jgi:transcription-repair coupling factor (superfamily II helicase)